MLSVRLLLLTIPLLSVATVGAATTDPLGGAIDEAVAARVNGRAIYFSQLQPKIDEVQARYRKYGAGNVSAERKRHIQKEELDRQVGYELLAQAGERVVGSGIEAQVDQSIKAKHAADSKSEQALMSLERDLKNDQYRNQVRRKLLIDGYLAKQGLQEIRVPESELKQYYEQNRQGFKESESVRVSHILIALPKNSNPEEITTARKKIEQIRQEVLGGVSFAELARKYSACATAKEGGDLGYISQGYMPRDFDRVAFTLKKGEISDVVRTRYGFHIIKAADKKPERIQEFAEVKDFIEKFLIKSVQAKRIDDIVKELRREAKVEVLLK